MSRDSKIVLQHVWWALPVALSFTLLALAPLREGDLWWHLKLGEIMVTTRELPLVDSLTVAGYGLPFNSAHSWLSDVVFYLLESAGGLAALVTLQAAVGALSLELLLRVGRHAESAVAPSAMVILLGFLALYPFSNARPQIFSFFFFAVLLAILCAFSMGRTRWLPVLPVVMALWVNMHGAWVMGLLLLGAFGMVWMVEAWAGRREWRTLRSFVLWALIATLAIGLNPHGFRIYEHLIVIGTSSVVQQFVSEWQPPSLTQAFTWPFWALLVLGLVSLLRRPRYWDGATLAALGFTLLALRYLRMIPFAVIAWLPVILNRLPRSASLSTRITAANRWVLMVFLLFAVLSTPYVRIILGASPTTLIDPYFPATACEVLEQRAPQGGGVFTLPEWGGYVAWNLGPEFRPFLDGRVEMPPQNVWEEYLAVATAQPEWEEVLQRWGIAYLLLSRERQPDLALLAQESGWQVWHTDEKTLLLAHP